MLGCGLRAALCYLLDGQTVVERLEKLERQNQRLRQAALLALLPAFTLLLTCNLVRTDRGVVEATTFVLEDAEGRRRSEFFVADGPRLQMYDATGKAKVVLADTVGGPNLFLIEKGQKVPSFSEALTQKANLEGYSLALYPYALALEHDGQTLAEFRTEDTSTTSLMMFEKHGKVIWRAP